MKRGTQHDPGTSIRRGSKECQLSVLCLVSSDQSHQFSAPPRLSPSIAVMELDKNVIILIIIVGVAFCGKCEEDFAAMDLSFHAMDSHQKLTY